VLKKEKHSSICRFDSPAYLSETGGGHHASETDEPEALQEYEDTESESEDEAKDEGDEPKLEQVRGAMYTLEDGILVPNGDKELGRKLHEEWEQRKEEKRKADALLTEEQKAANKAAFKQARVKRREQYRRARRRLLHRYANMSGCVKFVGPFETSCLDLVYARVGLLCWLFH